MHARIAPRVAILALVAVLGGTALLAGCNGGGTEQAEYQWQPLFGDFTKDTSPVIARVGDIVITERNLELYLAEMPPARRKRYEGPEGERLAVNTMVDEVLFVKGAIETEIWREPGVAQNLLSLRRTTLEYAMRNVGLLKDKVPTEEQLHEFYVNNKDKYRTQARVYARHIECDNKPDAVAAYKRLTSGKYEDTFPFVLKDYSTNLLTKAKGGDLGWISAKGFVPHVENAQVLAAAVATYEVGVHEPLRVGDKWHVVEVTERVDSRPETFAEAKQTVQADMLPGFQKAIIEEWLASQRARYDVELTGRMAPGQGLKPEELYARAMAVTDLERKVELLTMLQQDYPDDQRADDALFMGAYAAMEAYRDLSIAGRLLDRLISEYPDSEFKDDAQYLRENLYNPAVRNPSSAEDLRRGN